MSYAGTKLLFLARTRPWRKLYSLSDEALIMFMGAYFLRISRGKLIMPELGISWKFMKLTSLAEEAVK